MKLRNKLSILLVVLIFTTNMHTGHITPLVFELPEASINKIIQFQNEFDVLSNKYDIAVGQDQKELLSTELKNLLKKVRYERSYLGYFIRSFAAILTNSMSAVSAMDIINQKGLDLISFLGLFGGIWGSAYFYRNLYTYAYEYMFLNKLQNKIINKLESGK